MAYRAPGRTPVLNLGEATNFASDPDDNEPSFARFLDLPPELRRMVYEEYFDDLGIIPAEEHDNQPALTRASSQLRQESLPLYYSHCTFACAIDVWPPVFYNTIPPTSLEDNTIRMLENLSREHLSRIKHLKLHIDFDMVPLRNFIVTLDLTKWHDFDRAIHIERTMPLSYIQYSDTFRFGLGEAMQTLFDYVRPRPRDGGRVNCRRVLWAAETAVDLSFYDDRYWSQEAYHESMEAVKALVRSERER